MSRVWSRSASKIKGSLPYQFSLSISLVTRSRFQNCKRISVTKAIIQYNAFSDFHLGEGFYGSLTIPLSKKYFSMVVSLQRGKDRFLLFQVFEESFKTSWSFEFATFSQKSKMAFENIRELLISRNQFL